MSETLEILRGFISEHGIAILLFVTVFLTSTIYFQIFAIARLRHEDAIQKHKAFLASIEATHYWESRIARLETELADLAEKPKGLPVEQSDEGELVEWNER